MTQERFVSTAVTASEVLHHMGTGMILSVPFDTTKDAALVEGLARRHAACVQRMPIRVEKHAVLELCAGRHITELTRLRNHSRIGWSEIEGLNGETARYFVLTQ